MTNPIDDDRPENPHSEEPPPNVPGPAGAAGEAASTASSEVPPSDELPEWEPLTPELVEDEAIRGDFVIRWAVVGLAILLGCSAIADTKTLIHIRSGEYLAQHGFLPPANDVFSFTRADAPWINLSWMFDVVTAGVHALTGGIGLSLLQATLAALTFGLLVHTVRPGIRTWWGSVCATFAVLACFRQFTIQPELITLLGLSLTLWWLVRTQEGTETRGQWAIVPLIWGWSQLDQRAFFGWGLLLLYGLGEIAGTWLGRPSFRDRAQRKRFWLMTIVCVLVAGLHPFFVQVWTSPWRLYALEYPAWRDAYPVGTRSELWTVSLLQPLFWSAINYEGMAAICLFLAALVTMLLNARRVPIAHLALYLGFNAAALFAAHELAVASLVNCVLSTLNAQDWFLAKYGQTYSTQAGFLLFTRGGRAVTVVALFALAYLTISGRIDGPNGKRTGIGFDPNLQSQMDSYTSAVVDSYDDRPFPFVVRQGDLLIWAGQKSFIDSRLELFYSPQEEHLIALHDQTRRALRKRDPNLEGSGERTFWRKIFDQYQVTHALPRLEGLSLGMNYRSFDDLLRSPDWKLTRLASAAAVFYRVDNRQDKELRAYVDAHQFNAVKTVFREDTPRVEEPQLWPSDSSSYQKMLSLPRTTIPEGITQGANELHLAKVGNLPFPQQLAIAQNAIRTARNGLRNDPNNADGYQVLGAAYSMLDRLENQELQRYGIRIPQMLRYYQILTSLQNAVRLEPQNLFVREELANFCLPLNKFDLALPHLKEMLQFQEKFFVDVENSEPNQTSQVDRLRQIVQQIEDHLAKVQDKIETQLGQGTNRLNVALWSYQNGAVESAVRMLDDDKVSLLQSPPAMVMYGGWLLEMGRAEEADQILRTVDRQLGPAAMSIEGWRDNSVYAAWAQGNYSRVLELYQEAINQGEQRRVQSALISGPFTSSPSPALPADRYPWMHIATMEEIEAARPFEMGTLLLNSALCQIEQVDLAGAKTSLHEALERAPRSPVRPLLITYWQCLTDERLEIEPPSDWIPIQKDLFADEPN